MPRWLKITLKTLGVIIGIIVLLSVAATVYVAFNKKKILAALTTEASKNLNGTLTVGDLSPSFFSGFPGISVSLTNVVLRDSLWRQHKHDLINADKIQVTVNAWALIKGNINISKIALSKSRIFLYTDSTGYSNTAVFGASKKKPADNKDKKAPSIEIGKVDMDDVDFTLDNQYRKKLFHFTVNSFSANMDYPSSGLQADIKLKTFVHDLGFNTRRGSFVKNKMLDGTFQIKYDEEKKTIVFSPQKVNIGGSPFVIGAQFNTAKEPLAFRIDIKTPGILWKNAAALLAPNISKKLAMFDIKNPIPVQTSIVGDFGAGDPVITVKTQVDKNTLTTVGGVITDAHFNGVFTNADIPAKGANDANSAIKLFALRGNYQGIAFEADTTIISNLKETTAKGVFKARFPLEKLNAAINYDGIKFNKGEASVNLRYNADVVNYKFSKPKVQGDVIVSKADISYVPRNIRFSNGSFAMLFRGDDLLLKNIHLQSGKSIIKMNGSVKNFLNFYYTAPEKIVVNWDIYSPQIYLTEFLGYLGNRRSGPVQTTTKKTSVKSTPAAQRIDQLLEKSQVIMKLKVDKIFYKNFAATNARSIINISEQGVKLEKFRVNHAGGYLDVQGNISPAGTSNRFNLKAVVSNVNISTFFYSFDNFGIRGLGYKNLKGYFFSNITASGAVTDKGSLVPRSINGVVTFDLKKGALVNFPPFVSLSRYALKGRSLDNISFTNLNGKFDINKEKIRINPMKINSSALNMDIEGIYSLIPKGTRINLDVPLRNPKKDEDITDKALRRERRMKGIVLHLTASDEDTGKMKIGFTGDRKPVYP